MKNIIGIIPAAGHGTRLSPLPCSKEIFPVGFIENEKGLTPKPIALYLIERMIKAEVNKIFIIISKGKWDIPNYFGNGARFGIPIAYLIQEKIHGIPYALNLANSWIEDKTILFGMPDAIFSPQDAFSKMLNYHNVEKADLTLGAFPTNTPHRFGMIDFDAQGTLTFSIDKPLKTHLKYLWGIACWSRRFSEFLNAKIKEKEAEDMENELLIGNFFQLAHDANLTVKVFPFQNGKYIDIGYSESLITALKSYQK